jgi:hypothetical protein
MMTPMVVIKVHNTKSLSIAVQRRLLMMLMVVLAVAVLFTPTPYVNYLVSEVTQQPMRRVYQWVEPEYY